MKKNNRSFKKIITSILAVSMATALCFNVSAAAPAGAKNAGSGTATDSVTTDPAEKLVFDADTGTVTGYDDYTDAANLVIPSKINGVSVKSIGKGAFEGCVLTSITIPDSVTSIGDGAFCRSYNLTSINIPGGVTSIGKEALSDCQSLAGITVDSDNQNYTSENGVLFDKEKTKLIQYPIGSTQAAYIIPSSVTSIGDGAFYDCMTSLASVTIPSGVTSIGDEAFFYCYELASLTIPDSVTSIGDRAFFACSGLTSVTIPGNVESIGDSPLAYCDNLTDISVDPDNKNYTSGNGILFNKDKTKLIQYPAGKTLTAYAIPDSVTAIGDSAFGWCKNLISITIPDSVTTIGEAAFLECESLKSAAIPDGVTSVSQGEFAYCYELTSVSIPDGVTSIGSYAFKMCNTLASIYIPSSVTSIDDGAFEETGLSSVTIPDGVTRIGCNAFWRCCNLTSVNIPESVASIGDGAFKECSGLTSISVYTGNQNYTSKNGVLFNKDMTHLIRYPAADTRSAYTVPNSVTSIDEGAFSECSNLTSVTIPQSVTNIGAAVFMDCDSLTIYGTAGSCAQSYANEIGVPFKESQAKTASA